MKERKKERSGAEGEFYIRAEPGWNKRQSNAHSGYIGEKNCIGVIMKLMKNKSEYILKCHTCQKSCPETVLRCMKCPRADMTLNVQNVTSRIPRIFHTMVSNHCEACMLKRLGGSDSRTTTSTRTAAWRVTRRWRVSERRLSSSPWLPDGYRQIFRIVCVWPFELVDNGSATLRCKIVPPRPPPWHNPRKGRDQILPYGNHVNRIHRIHHSVARAPLQLASTGGKFQKRQQVRAVSVMYQEF